MQISGTHARHMSTGLSLDFQVRTMPECILHAITHDEHQLNAGNENDGADKNNAHLRTPSVYDSVICLSDEWWH